jgi:formamidopyrimidine-DNA glycosylase
MPELPEVEIVQRGLAPSLVGARFDKVVLHRPDLRFPFPRDFRRRLEGREVLGVHRRAKYIVADIEGDSVLAIHLGMTGRFTAASGKGIEQPGSFYYDHGTDARHDHVRFDMSNGSVVTYNDVRRFGYMTAFAKGDLPNHPLFRGLGVEPLSDVFNGSYLLERGRDRNVTMKSLLMDQRVVAGLGNIYVCEGLFRAGLSPEKRACDFASGRGAAKAAAKLADSIKAVLTDAIEAGGSSFRDYRHADGTSGQFQDRFAVYARAGEPCSNDCGATIERVVQQGRSTFYCPRCQKKP